MEKGLNTLTCAKIALTQGRIRYLIFSVYRGSSDQQ